MAKPDADFLFCRHFHDLLHLRQNFAVLAAQAHAFMLWMPGAAPEAIGGEGWKPDHLEDGTLELHAHVIPPHAKPHALAPVSPDAVRELASSNHVADMALRKVGRRRADIPVVFEGDPAHAALGRLDGDLDHVLGTMDKVRN